MFKIPEWAYEFHGHKCPFMPIGYRMGTVAMEKLGVGKAHNHELFVFSEMGIGHPQGCLQDGIQSATAATFGKGQMFKLFYGKIAATFYQPQKGAVRIALKSTFTDSLNGLEFFVYRKKGIEPSDIPEKVSQEVIDLVLKADNEGLFTIEPLPDFKYTPVKGSFNKSKCALCGEYVFERYLRVKDGEKICIPCSNRESQERTFYLPL